MKKLSLIVAAVVLLALAAVLAWVLVLTEGLAATGESVEWAQFVGRFHPVVLHLPIGLFLGLCAIELVALRQRSVEIQRCALLLVWLMALTSAFAAYCGLLLASNGDYSGETFAWHKWLGIGFATVTLLLAFFKMLAVQASLFGSLLYRVLMLGLLLLLPAVSHYGGHLTHGVGYLTQYAPEWLNALFEGDSADELTETVEASTDAVLQGNRFTQEVQPIFEQYCIECHGPEKQKSRYRMDTYASLLTPGSLGDTPIVPGHMARSVLLDYMLLPESDEMAMPPEGKPRPSADQILLIAHWIAGGAEGPPVDEAALAAEQAAREAERAQIEALFSAGVVLLPIGRDSDLLYLDLQNAESLSNYVLQALAAYEDRIYELKLSGCRDAHALLQILQGARELRKLDLRGMQSADAAMTLVNSFAGLEVLNLFGSDLSNKGLTQLALPKLQSLYLGSTQVSSDRLTAFAQAVPAVEVLGDVDLSQVEAIEAIGAANSSEFAPEAKE